MRLVFLHGHDSSPSHMADLATSLAELVPQAEVVVPQGLCEVGPGTYAWWMGEGNHAAALSALDELRLRVDLDGSFVIGFSQGGALALAAAMDPSTALRGAVCAGGFLPAGILVSPDAAPLLLLHGDDDEVVDVFYSETLARSAERAGVDVTLQTYAGSHRWSDDAAGRIAAWIADHLGPDRNDVGTQVSEAETGVERSE
jgi:predicted esterase